MATKVKLAFSLVLFATGFPFLMVAWMFNYLSVGFDPRPWKKFEAFAARQLPEEGAR